MVNIFLFGKNCAHKNNACARFCFLTDVGCQYSSDLLHKFMDYLQKNPKCVGVTGRRVAQSQYQQADPAKPEQEDSFTEGMLRALQSHSFESENNNKLENVIECVPVLHGHCTFMDWTKAGFISGQLFDGSTMSHMIPEIHGSKQNFQFLRCFWHRIK